MIRTTKITSFLTVLLLGLATALFAADEKGQKMTEQGEMEVTAEIVAVDRDAKTITVQVLDHKVGETAPMQEYTTESGEWKESGKKLTLKITDDTHIWEDGRDPMVMAELQPGQRVNVKFEKSGEEAHARDIERKKTKEGETE